MWPTRYSWASRRFIDIRKVGEPVDVTYDNEYDSDSDPLSQFTSDYMLI